MQSTKAAKSLLQKCEVVSQVLKSLSHPVRLKILCRILDKEQSVNQLTEFCDISQSAMSQFLKRMKNEGVLKSRREKTFIYYSIADKNLLRLMQSVKDIYC